MARWVKALYQLGTSVKIIVPYPQDLIIELDKCGLWPSNDIEIFPCTDFSSLHIRPSLLRKVLIACVWLHLIYCLWRRKLIGRARLLFLMETGLFLRSYRVPILGWVSKLALIQPWAGLTISGIGLKNRRSENRWLKRSEELYAHKNCLGIYTLDQSYVEAVGGRYPVIQFVPVVQSLTVRSVENPAFQSFLARNQSKTIFGLFGHIDRRKSLSPVDF